MNHWAVPGAQCVCINDDFGSIEVGGCIIPTRVPMLNEVLTVRSVRASGESVYLTFEEFDPWQSSSDGERTISGTIAFDAVCFRPLNKRKTDISIFKAMLTPAGRIPVDA